MNNETFTLYLHLVAVYNIFKSSTSKENTFMDKISQIAKTVEWLLLKVQSAIVRSFHNFWATFCLEKSKSASHVHMGTASREVTALPEAFHGLHYILHMPFLRSLGVGPSTASQHMRNITLGPPCAFILSKLQIWVWDCDFETHSLKVKGRE